LKLRQRSASEPRSSAADDQEAADGGCSASYAPGSAAVHRRQYSVSQMLVKTLEALERQDRSSFDSEGFIQIARLLRLRPEFQREAFASPKIVAQAAEVCPGVVLDQARRRVRLRHPGKPEQGQEEAARCRSTWRLREAAEGLFSDKHLEEDQRLRARLTESATATVPLTWLCSRYAERLGLPPPDGAKDSSEALALELCQALEGSEVLSVDARRLTVSRNRGFKPGEGKPSSPAGPEAGSGACETPERKAGGGQRVATQLRSLLNFYFEPFTMQHNRFLVDLVARNLGPPKEVGPWVAEALMNFSCSIQDLSGLGRIETALSKLGPRPDLSDVHSGLGELKYLQPSPNGQLKLKKPLEVRSFMAAPEAPQEAVNAVVRYLAAKKEQRGQAPSNTVSVLFYSLSEPLADESELGNQRRSRLKRQLLVHHTDLLCLQGLDPKSGHGVGLAAALTEEGYASASSRAQGQGNSGEASSIFWDRSRWELHCQQECDQGLAVDLRPFEDPNVVLRVISLRPSVPMLNSDGLRRIFHGCVSRPLLVGADLSLLGGAAAACLVEELVGLPSVAQHILGEELAAPIPAAPVAGRKGQSVEPAPAISAASGLNKLRCPDAVFFGGGLTPLAALSGHTEGYLATMPAEEVLQQFPAFRMPSVAAFDWRRTWMEGIAPRPLGAKRVVRV